MGAAFDCRCNDCSHEFKLVQGGGFASKHVCCDGCGDTKSLPRFAPRARPENVGSPRKKLHRAIDTLVISEPFESRLNPDLSEDQLRSYFQRRDEPLWRRSGDSWRTGEWQILLSFLGDCSCGGQWVEPTLPSGGGPHALHRCPNCRSRSFSYRYPDVVFD
jgi:hypothetical protein